MEPTGKVTCQGNHKGRKERVGLVLGIDVGKRQLFHGLRYVPRIITEEKKRRSFCYRKLYAYGSYDKKDRHIIADYLPKKKTN